ncbi:uncharacterized protein K02A2.6-like [Rhipicephalus sanguineus]|uniref:uncharacterized protein K02A2.6-like n=1 Tax=Rhipicephalus sanguineus TaxID=34632 RepID=UPI001893959C|nr:uncharacterized protein K02A2.6-like [Rhipicephalus sanguineus]
MKGGDEDNEDFHESWTRRAMSVGRPPVFEGTWSTFRVRLEAYFEAQDITDATKRRAVLVASLPDSAIRVIQGRCHPRQINALNYDDAVKHLEEYYAPEVNEIASTLVIVDTPGPALCGRDTIKAFNNCGVAMMIPNFVANLNTRKEDRTSQQLQTLLKEFEDVFSPGLGLYKGPPVKLILRENATPRFCKARTVPYALTTKVSDALDRLVADGVISPVMAAEWATPVVPVVKTDGSIRLCGDFRLTVNVATVTEQYPLPRVDDIFARLNGGEVFSTLDLTQAYNQLPLDNEAKKLTVINTHKGLFCFNRLPFGISSAPAIFQRHMDSLFKDLPGVQAYLDDIIVAEKRNDTSLLKQVLQRLRDYGLRLNIKKCKFRQEEVTFLGHRVDANGLKPKDDNIEAVLQAPVPKSQVKFWIKKGWPKFFSEEQTRFRPYFSKKAELTYYQDLVYWGHRIVLPTALNRRILDLLHETHPGMATMKNIARSLFWFPGLDGEIERLVRECPACVQAAAMPPAQTPVPWPTTGEKWSRLHADYAGPIEGHMILVVVDSETKWIEAVPTKSATAEVTVEALRAMFARFGLPRTLVTDNGPQFTGFHFRNFLAQNQLGPQATTSSAGCPQSMKPQAVPALRALSIKLM